ncbi:ABC transporter substrate-binding protein [Streptomyces sp. NPDC057623]|uniref:ABC transporter substrate-binding protein n=1 Tax=Streptomyces sp. NPDC057623 TaxID=3346187 RepID=UPI00367CDFDC
MGKTKIATVLALVAAVSGVLSACGGEPARAAGDCRNFKIAVADDDVRRTALWAISHDQIDTSKFPGLKVSYLTIPALIQAVGTDQYDVIESSLIGVPLARSKGIDLRILAVSSGRASHNKPTPSAPGIYVPKGSDINSVKDLAGKKIGVTSFGSTTTLNNQIVLHENYGFNAELQGGDMKWVELDPAQLTTALDRGRVDAAAVTSFPAYVLGTDGKHRRVMDTDAEWRKATGGHNIVGGAYVALADQVDANETCYQAFQAMLTKSIDYAKANLEKIAVDVAEQTGLPKGFILTQWGEGTVYDYLGNLDGRAVADAQAFLDKAAQTGDIPKPFEIQDVVVR